MLQGGSASHPQDLLTQAPRARASPRRTSMSRGGRFADKLLAAFRSSTSSPLVGTTQQQLPQSSFLHNSLRASSSSSHAAAPASVSGQLPAQAKRGRPPKAAATGPDREARQPGTSSDIVPRRNTIPPGACRTRYLRQQQQQFLQQQQPHRVNGHHPARSTSVQPPLAGANGAAGFFRQPEQQAAPLLDQLRQAHQDQERWRSEYQGGNGASAAALTTPPQPSSAGFTQHAQTATSAADLELLAAATADLDISSSSGGIGNGIRNIASASLDSEDLPQEAIQQVYRNKPPPDVHIVSSAAEARVVAAQLAAFTPEQLAGMVFACDTEVMDIDVSAHSPCCHGRVICFSVYCGPEHHFGAEAEPEVKRSMLWVDTYLDGDEEKQDEVLQILEAFRPFFASAAHRKVWHNYSFDRHILERAGYDMRGFAGDTMHMARLWDSSRMTKGGYSLEALSGNAEIMGGGGEGQDDAVRGKVSMKKLFGRKNLKKDGTEGKLVVLPAVEELQRGADTRWVWVNYSAYDAKSTWDLHAALADKLRALDVTRHVDEAVVRDFASPRGLAGQPLELRTMWDVYCHFYLPFGDLLTDMEAVGLAVDRAHLAQAQQLAEKEQEEAKARFRSWATAAVPGAELMNVSSGPQVSQLLFAGCPNKNPDKEGVPLERVFKVPNTTGFIEEGAKKAKKTRDITLHSVWGPGRKSPLTPQIYTPGGAPGCNTVVIKQLAGKAGKARKALAELEARPDTGFERDDAYLASLEAGADAIAPEGDALVDAVDLDDDEGATWTTDNAAITERNIAMQQAVLPRTPADLEREAAEKGYGKLYAHFGTAMAGLRACAAVDALVDVSAIDTLLSNFIIPLQSDAISKPDAAGVPRVHCSLNINTETGRLSARRPNLQNQPALEKDRYKVRKAFTADVAAGKTLVVADYGQLELRILAHMANCTSMIEAFELGGDFHSRTALGMYDHIKEAIAAGKCLLEWKGGESGDEPPPVPLLKDMFASERRKAKVLNFSIAYGKTAHGLSKDWGVDIKEAEETVNRWYSDRWQVRDWQRARREEAVTLGYVCTLLGRRRQLPDARSKNRAASSHALRAAINTPIQGSAADVAMAAMLRINSDPELAALGYKLLLQVHDEVILEGPREHAEAARRRVIECMRSPFNASTDKPLRVDLVVDCKFADTWYEAK